MKDPLLAKSWTGPVASAPLARTLVGHTICVLGAVSALFGRQQAPTRLAYSWLRFFGLAEADFPRFLRHLVVAAAVHDWGKANQPFQEAVTKQEEQVIRHEHLSGLLLADLMTDKSVLAWLNGSGIDEVVLLAAVISHHVKVGAKGEHALGAYMGKRETLRLLSSHDDFATIWRMVEDEVGSSCPALLNFPALWRKEDLKGRSLKTIRSLDRYASVLREDHQRNRWVGAIRASLIVADAVGSAVVRMEDDGETDAERIIDRWVKECFATILTGEDVWAKITRERIRDLRRRGRWTDSGGFDFEDESGFSEFQVKVAEQGSRVLLAAPCGSGKTLAAWNWIKAQLDRSPAARVIFLYPTRATATEGFRDYVSWAPEDEAGLLSGTADYELQDMFETPDDFGDLRGGRDYRSDPRLYALGHWKKRIFSATADQFFPFMQYQYGPICRGCPGRS
jgi:CRISPR-associated endonuclease/helicase Cas3